MRLILSLISINNQPFINSGLHSNDPAGDVDVQSRFERTSDGI